MTRSFAAALLSGSPDALELLPDYRDAAQRRAAAEVGARLEGRRALVDVLASQDVPRGPLALRSLDRLSHPSAVAVVTGQQAGLFGGPLLTMVKLLSAVVNARALEAELGRPVVPVFWLQNEDHDFAEIAETWVPARAAGLLRVAVEPSAGCERCSVAHHPLNESVVGALFELSALLGEGDGARAVVSSLEDAYVPGRSIAAAFATWLSGLVDAFGVVIVDSRDAGLASLALPIHLRALDGASAIASGLLARDGRLTELGFRGQVHVRPGAPLAFFHPTGPLGPRYRLETHDGGYALVGPGDLVTRAQLRAAAEADPRVLSSSALLRPIIQDSLLPTVAYVGGPAELAYFAQIGPVYEHFGRPMPLIVPRSRVRLIEERARRLLQDLALTPGDVSRPRDDLLAFIASRDTAPSTDAPPIPAPDQLRERLQARIRDVIAAEEAVVTTVDPTLRGPLEKLADATGDSVVRFVQKYERAWRGRDQLTGDRLDRLRVLLEPNGVPQERVHGLPYYLARYPDLLQRLLGAIEPFSGGLIDVELGAHASTREVAS
ncbi:MAG: bacillithiol biosynthesis cysteine-adding enzyme BshC [Myxococcales bacterium]|nr:bacillithiol biosynthesis cysteine-adding enzyme BshC [Myxococcales bacterium]